MTITLTGNMAEGVGANVVASLATAYTVPTGYQSKVTAIIVVNNRSATAATWAITANTAGTDYPIAEGFQVINGAVYASAPNIVLPAGAIIKTGCDASGGVYTPIITGLGVTYIVSIEESKVT